MPSRCCRGEAQAHARRAPRPAGRPADDDPPADAIGRELDERGITTPAAIGAALGMPAAEATKLLTRHQWREGDVALLQVAAARLGI